MVATVYCVVCVIEYGWYVGRGDCGVCGWKDRCRDGNLRTYKSIKKIQKNLRRCRDEVPKSKQTRCRDSRNTKLNVHSPIPTSFSHVTATVLGHYQYNIILSLSAPMCRHVIPAEPDVITHEHLFCMGM